MTTTNTKVNKVAVLVRLSPEDIRTIRTALPALLKMYGREEGYGAIRDALADLPSSAELEQLEVEDQLHTLACACRDAGVCREGALASLAQAGGPSAKAPASHPPRERATLTLIGLASGERAAFAVERALQRTPGVVRAYVSPATEMAYLEYDGTKTSLAALSQLIESLGYHATRARAT